jgi:RNA polymerase sigma-70 factor (ECF subfamily)
MAIETIDIWNKFNSEIYFFILKKTKDTDVTNEILQNSFLKIHQNLENVKNPEKIKSWVFQIVRNEIANYYNSNLKTSHTPGLQFETSSENYLDLCCFDRFMSNLPEGYKEVIQWVYIDGKTQLEVAEIMGLSLANVKARVRRAKMILIQNFNECCKFSINDEGKLVGESNCSRCQ